MKLQGIHVVVVGMARSGIAAAELLLEHGAHVRAVDQNHAAVEIDHHQFTVEPQTESSFSGADLIVLSPGVPGDLPAIETARRAGESAGGSMSGHRAAPTDVSGWKARPTAKPTSWRSRGVWSSYAVEFGGPGANQ